jgi:hypothetical protein
MEEHKPLTVVNDKSKGFYLRQHSISKYITASLLTQASSLELVSRALATTEVKALSKA